MKNKKIIAVILIIVFMVVAVVWAGTAKRLPYGLRLGDEGAAHDTPPSGFMDIYANGDVLYSIDDQGNITNLDTASAPALSTVTNPAADKTFTWADNYTFIHSFADTNEDMMIVKGVGAFADVSVMKIIQETGAATDGTVLEVVSSDANVDPLVVSTSGQAGVLTVSQDGSIDIIGDLDMTGALSVTGAFYQSGLASAASGNTNLTIDAAGTGTITIGATSTGKIVTDNLVDLDGSCDIGTSVADTFTIVASIDGNVVIDDGVTDSPSFSLKDATNETCAIAKKDNGDTEVTIPADTDFEIVTGNLAVGNGSPGTAAMDGEDFYVNGDSEFDGAVTLDGAVQANSTISSTGNVTLDDGTGASPSLTFTDATDETAAFSKADSGYLSVTTAAADGLSVLTGNLKIGAGTPDETIAGVDLYVTGLIEADEVIRADAGLDVNEQIDIDLNANDEEISIDSTAVDYAAGAGIVTVHGDHAGNTNDAPLVRLVYQGNGDAQDTFILCEDNSTGAAANGDAQFTVASGGVVTAAGNINANGNIVGDGATVVSGVAGLLEVVAAVNVITAAETGSTFVLNSGTEFQSTLPAVGDCTAGAKFKFIIGAAPAGASYTIITANALENVIQGLVVVNGASVPGAAEDTITFANGNAVVGDWLEVITDGTNWYVSGQGHAAGAITLTQAD